MQQGNRKWIYQNIWHLVRPDAYSKTCATDPKGTGHSGPLLIGKTKRDGCYGENGKKNTLPAHDGFHLPNTNSNYKRLQLLYTTLVSNTSPPDKTDFDQNLVLAVPHTARADSSYQTRGQSPGWRLCRQPPKWPEIETASFLIDISNLTFVFKKTNTSGTFDGIK